ncbi:T9SS type A sorting domain-containing protein [Aestuariivivens insulae]|uniref:T9SS type A sorting domain-containing protein n=1 Tax=Aestuariivivens insulae TaxID=1621988 RepID=UPI001F571808|nr:T9SS type A sorting domain-containing protein [Aestuariivivens insulae]
MKAKLFLAFILMCVMISNAQIRFTEVNIATESVTIKNFGNSTVNISSWQLCVYPAYAQLNTMTGSSLNLAAGASVTFTSTISLSDNDGELGLYISGPFGTASNMRDYIQWKAGGHFRESVAVAAGIWTSGTFISSSAPNPYSYTGDGTTFNGVNDWDPTLSANEFSKSALNIYPNPTTSYIYIKNADMLNIKSALITNIIGERIVNYNVTKSRIDVSNLRQGLYFLNITTNKGKTIKRFIKQ